MEDREVLGAMKDEGLVKQAERTGRTTGVDPAAAGEVPAVRGAGGDAARGAAADGGSAFGMLSKYAKPELAGMEEGVLERELVRNYAEAEGVKILSAQAGG